MNAKLSFSSYFVIGVMLFALFFGAGNLIFPASLGQNAGSNVWIAITGFLLTGIGLPFLGILAMGYSGSRSLQDLASRIHPLYAIIFTSILYLTIGPFFAIPRTGAVSYEVGIAPFVGSGFEQLALGIFTIVFFGITLWFSLNPAKLIDRVGKILSPAILVLLFILLVMVIVKPMGIIEAPQDAYVNGAFMKGFTEGYNTMDALASLVFGIIVINAIRKMGVTSKRDTILATVKAGGIATLLLGVVYIGIAYLGATSTNMLGISESGGPVLSGAASHYFGVFGMILLAILISLACLTTSIGLTIACGEYFHSLIPKISYKLFVIVFSLFSFVVSNVGLSNIITFSIPVLMFIYPLAIVLILLTFASPLFKHARLVYISATVVTFMISSIDGLRTLCALLGIEYFAWMKPIVAFYESTLPFYSQGLGWLVPVLIVMVITAILADVFKLTVVSPYKRVTS